MIDLKPNISKQARHKGKPKEGKGGLPQSKSLPSMCKATQRMINQLYSPIDAINRFINLALQSLEEDSQNRQFLIESKRGIRKTSLLLRKLTNCSKRMEQEVNRITEEKHE